MKQLKTYFYSCVLVLGVLASSVTFGQVIKVSGGEEISPPKFEFGIAPYSLVVGQQALLSGESLGKQYYFTNALFARFWFKKINWRAQLNHYTDDYNFPDYQSLVPIPLREGDVFRNGKYSLNAATRKAQEIKLGWQQFITHTRVSPYITADLGYSHIQENLFYSEEKVEFNQLVYHNYLSKTVANRVGLYGGVGIRLQVTRFLSLSFETQASVNYDWKKTNHPLANVKNDLSLGLFPAQFLLGYYF